MKINELKSLGIKFAGNEFRPREFFIPFVGVQIIPEDYDIEDIFKFVYESGCENGKILGREEKINEIKKCLNINDES